MAIILANKYVPFKRGKKSRFIVSKILYVVCYISGSVCRKSNAVWSRLLIMFFFISFIFLFYSKVSAVAEVMCALSRINSMVYWEKKVVILLAGCKHLCDRHCAQSLSADTGKKQMKKKAITHVSTNFGGSRYCTKFLWHMALPHLYGQM